MNRIYREVQIDQIQLGFEIKRRILERLAKRMMELGFGDYVETGICPELNPDVIVISAGQALLFEAQNARASELLMRDCGLVLESLKPSERIRVHPSKGRTIVNKLKAAGITVSGDF